MKLSKKAAKRIAFEAVLTLRNRHGYWVCDLVAQWKLYCQLRAEARIDGSITDANIDRLIAAAGRHGVEIETIDHRRTK